MRVPTWATVIGICLMVFGGCSLSNSTQAIMLPGMLKLQQEFIETATEAAADSTTDSLSNALGVEVTKDESAESFNRVHEKMQEMLFVSEFTKTWTVRFGYIGIVVSLIYLLSGIFLLVRKEFSLKLVYIALMLSIVFSIIKSIVLISDSSGGLIAISAGAGNIAGIVVDATLLTVFATMDKSSYFGDAETVA